MLILTRRVGETVMIGDDVTITGSGVKGIRYASASMRRRALPCTGKRSTSASKREQQSDVSDTPKAAEYARSESRRRRCKASAEAR